LENPNFTNICSEIFSTFAQEKLEVRTGWLIKKHYNILLKKRILPLYFVAKGMVQPLPVIRRSLSEAAYVQGK
jgi:hypothetical protein